MDVNMATDTDTGAAQQGPDSPVETLSDIGSKKHRMQAGQENDVFSRWIMKLCSEQICLFSQVSSYSLHHGPGADGRFRNTHSKRYKDYSPNASLFRLSVVPWENLLRHNRRIEVTELYLFFSAKAGLFYSTRRLSPRSSPLTSMSTTPSLIERYPASANHSGLLVSPGVYLNACMHCLCPARSRYQLLEQVGSGASGTVWKCCLAPGQRAGTGVGGEGTEDEPVPGKTYAAKIIDLRPFKLRERFSMQRSVDHARV